jgi:tetratricopeptide (TPR) repeat protein
MKRSPYFLLVSILSAGVLVLLNAHFRLQENERSEIAHAQTLVALGENKPEQLQEALKITSRFLSRDPFHVHALFVQGWAQQRLGHPNEALANYQTLLEQLADIGKFAYFNRAILLEARGDLEQALVHFLGSVRLDPKLDFAWIRAVNLLRRLNRLQEALVTAEEGYSSNPQSNDLKKLRDELASLQPRQ